MRAFGLILLPFAVKLATAQYNIDPNSVSNQTRDVWCNDQQAACPLICEQTSAKSSDTEENSCDPATLQYSCVCSNGISPNASEYSQTIPFHECQEYGNQCVAACASGDTNCQYNCRAQHPCGAQSPTRINATTSSSTASMTSTSTGAGGAATNSAGKTIYSGLGGAATTSSSSSSSQTGSAAALNLGQSYGIFVVAAGIFGGFAFLL